MIRSCSRLASVLAGLTLVACGSGPALDPRVGFGPDPQLPEPRSGLFPVIKIAPAVGWPDGRMPTPAEGLRVQAFADGLDHPRWLYLLPNGDILVAETAAPPKPEGQSGGIRGWFAGLVMGEQSGLQIKKQWT